MSTVVNVELMWFQGELMVTAPKSESYLFSVGGLSDANKQL